VVSGPVEGIVTLCIIYAFTAYVGGGSFWQRSLFSAVGVPYYDFIPKAVYNLAWNEWYMFYAGAILVFNTVSRYASNGSQLWRSCTNSNLVHVTSWRHAVLVDRKRGTLSSGCSHSLPLGS
jgi:hypothetical protein